MTSLTWADILNNELDEVVSNLFTLPYPNTTLPVCELWPTVDDDEDDPDSRWYLNLEIPLSETQYLSGNWTLTREDAERACQDLIQCFHVVGADYQGIEARMKLLGHDGKVSEFSTILTYTDE